MRKILVGFILFVLIGVNNTVIAQEDAASILKKMDETKLAIKDKAVTINMVLLNTKSGKEKVKEAVLWQKGTNMKLFRYTAPESDAGIATLSLPNDEIYLYLPMFKKPKKITNLAESNTFNKSDFSLEDMSGQTYSERFTPKILSSEGNNYELDLTPKTDETSYSHLVVQIHKENYYPVTIDFYNKKNEVVKHASYGYTKVSGLWIADNISMEDLKKGHKTTLTMTDIKINQGLKDELFALENLAVKE